MCSCFVGGHGERPGLAVESGVVTTSREGLNGLLVEEPLDPGCDEIGLEVRTFAFADGSVLEEVFDALVPLELA